jgi:hypothetical protein
VLAECEFVLLGRVRRRSVISEYFVTWPAEPLDELADMVSTLFSPIKNRGQDPLPVIPDHPFGQKEMGVSPCLMLGAGDMRC